MTNKETYELLDSLFLSLVNNLPKAPSLLEVNIYKSIIADLLQQHQHLSSAIKPKADYAFDFFKDDDIYSIEKVKKSVYDVLNACVMYDNSPTNYTEKCYLSIIGTLETSFRNDKLKKI